MPTIQQLPEQVYNQIAAGEVVERPACILRELLDNSLDAGARNITVNIGLDDSYFIEVIDNGCGIAADQMELAFARHATSKINDFSDIYRLNTLGFRGEALASIAAVSIIEAESSDNDRGEGRRLVMEGGKKTENTDCEAPRGTRIMVRELFYNTPVRKKFLKSFSTEKSELKKEALKHALAADGFALVMNFVSGGKKKTEISIPVSFSLKDRIRYFMNRELTDSLIEIPSSASGHIKVSGYITSQKYRSRTRKDQYFIVKDRVISNLTMSTALNAAYQNILPSRQFPACFLSIEFPEDYVDINVHPSKKDMKFQDNSETYRAVYHTVKDTLYGGIYHAQKQEVQSKPPAEPTYSPTEESPDLFSKAEKLKLKDITEAPAAPGPAAAFHERASGTDREMEKDFRESLSGGIPNVIVLGQLARTYILYSIGDDLFIADQHAVHERINFERLRENLTASKDMQPLLVPAVIERNRTEVDSITAAAPFFRELGLEFEVFGQDAVKLDAVPAYIPKGRETDILGAVIDLVLENPELKREELMEKTLSTIACRASLMAGDSISNAEAEDLIRTLYKKDHIHACPHGRPFVKKLSLKELNRYFDR